EIAWRVAATDRGIARVRPLPRSCSTVPTCAEGDSMDIDTVRERAQAFCDALDAGDVEAATEHLSPELRRNLGEVLALLPLPSNESTVVSADRSGSGFNVVLQLLGETDQVELL